MRRRRAPDPPPILADYAPGAWWEPLPSGERPAERHDDLEVLLMREPGATLWVGSIAHPLPAGAFVAFWAGLPHRLRSGGKTPFFRCTVPFAWLDAWGLPASFLHELLGGAVVRSRSEPADDEALARRWTEDGRFAQTERRAARWLELQAWLLRQAQSEPSTAMVVSESPDAGSAPPGSLERVLRFVHGHYLEPLTLKSVAARVHLNPRYLTTLVRRDTGLSLMDYILRERVRHAQRLLASTDRKIIDIAFDSGFRSLSRFYAAFARHYGKSPGDFRAAAPDRMEPDFAPAPRPTAPAFGDPNSVTAPAAAPAFVLWVDDHPLNVVDERRALALAGVHSDIFTCNDDALHALARHDYALVVSDISRGHLRESGWDLLRAVRERTGVRLPFLFYTDRVTRRLQRRAAELGADGVYARSAPLLAKIHAHLHAAATEAP